MAARAIARSRRFAGTVTRIDLSPSLAATAQDLAAQEGLTDRVEFRAGDTRSLDVADATFNAVVAHTLVRHVDDPRAVIGEAARVVRRRGMVGILDGDYASLAFATPIPSRERYTMRRLSAR